MRAALVACAWFFATLAPASASDDAAFSPSGRRFEQRTGSAIYAASCRGCHMADGRGAEGAGAYPALADDARLGNATYAVAVVLNGHRNMPAFARALDDAQVAAVVTHVRTHFGNAFADPVTAGQVGALRSREQR